MKFESHCYFCGKLLDRYKWVQTVSPSGFSVTVASCSECAKKREEGSE